METVKNYGHSAIVVELRHRAEERLHAKKMKMDHQLSPEEMPRLIHELEVHQIELEMQNEALQQARDDVEKSLEKITDLYDFAPIGYFSLDRSWVICAVNLTAASLLGCERSRLIGCRFDQFVTLHDRNKFNAFIVTIGTSRSRKTCEVTLLMKKDDLPMVVQLEAVATASGQKIRLAMIDITGRKQIEAALRESENTMYKLAEMANDAILVLDENGVITSCNAATEKIFGYPVTGMNGRDFHQLFIPERLRHAAIQGFNRFRKHGTGPLIGRTTEVVALRRDGTEFPLELSVSALAIKGKWHAIAIMRDISDRRQLELKIQDAREYAENIVETVRRPLVVLDWNLVVISANRSFYHTFKVLPDDTIGKYFHDLGNRQWDIPGLRLLLEEIIQHDTGFNDYEVRHDFPGIGSKTILLNARQIYQKNIDSRIILLAMEDITERKLAEEKISEVIRQQQAILDNIPNIAWLKNKEGTYVAVNTPFSREFGMTPDELAGKNDFDLYPPELAVKYERDCKEVMASGTRTHYEETVVNKEGNIQYVEKIKTPIFDDKGEPIGIIGITYDITTRKKIEASLRHDSTHDALTGLYNRSFFDEELERFAHGRIFPVSIVMADVNGLKTVNDTQGHAVGDELIRLAGRIIFAVFRGEDIVARIGGDEFAILLPETDAHVAEEAVKRIKNCPEIVSGQVSIAFGIATAENADQLADALKLSDTKMYLDKTTQNNPRNITH